MRLRHTFRTDPELAGDREQTPFRLSKLYRGKVDEVVKAGEIPDIRSRSDLFQDAVWLWFYEHERTNGGGRRSKGVLRADPPEPGKEAGEVPEELAEDPPQG